MNRAEPSVGVWSATLAGLDARLLEIVSLPWDRDETSFLGATLMEALARASAAIESIAPSTSHEGLLDSRRRDTIEFTL